MKIRILRRDMPQDKSYWQIFDCEPQGRVTVAAILDMLNNRGNLRDAEGRPCRRIKWECGCMQKMCGACAMVINHVPGLACNTFIDTDKMQELVLEPLTKFKVVVDLTVDRSCISEYLKEAKVFPGHGGSAEPGEFENRYQVAKCLKCGLCLEVCPNYTGTGNSFFGAVLANEAYLECASTPDRKPELKKEYREHFMNGCSKSLACRAICPAKIQTLSSIGYMNRL